jgi:hypothetical protein
MVKHLNIQQQKDSSHQYLTRQQSQTKTSILQHEHTHREESNDKPWRRQVPKIFVSELLTENPKVTKQNYWAKLT